MPFVWCVAVAVSCLRMRFELPFCASQVLRPGGEVALEQMLAEMMAQKLERAGYVRAMLDPWVADASRDAFCGLEAQRVRAAHGGEVQGITDLVTYLRFLERLPQVPRRACPAAGTEGGGCVAYHCVGMCGGCWLWRSRVDTQKQTVLASTECGSTVGG